MQPQTQSPFDSGSAATFLVVAVPPVDRSGICRGNCPSSRLLVTAAAVSPLLGRGRLIGTWPAFGASNPWGAIVTAVPAPASVGFRSPGEDRGGVCREPHTRSPIRRWPSRLSFKMRNGGGGSAGGCTRWRGGRRRPGGQHPPRSLNACLTIRGGRLEPHTVPGLLDFGSASFPDGPNRRPILKSHGSSGDLRITMPFRTGHARTDRGTQWQESPIVLFAL
jgi:hypothetical protein